MKSKETCDESMTATGATNPIPLRAGEGGLVDVSSYANGRALVGTTVFVVRPHWAQLWTLDDGELLVLLGQGRQLLHWEPSLESMSAAEERALVWLTEPPEEDS